MQNKYPYKNCQKQTCHLSIKFLGYFMNYLVCSSLLTSQHSATSCDVPLWSSILLHIRMFRDRLYKLDHCKIISIYLTLHHCLNSSLYLQLLVILTLVTMPYSWHNNSLMPINTFVIRRINQGLSVVKSTPINDSSKEAVLNGLIFDRVYGS